MGDHPTSLDITFRICKSAPGLSITPITLQLQAVPPRVSQNPCLFLKAPVPQEEDISMRAPCTWRSVPAPGARSPAGKQPGKKNRTPPAARFAGTGRRQHRPSPPFPHPSAHRGPRHAIQLAIPVGPGQMGCINLGSCPDILESRGIAHATGRPQRLTQLPGRAFPRDLQRGGRTTQGRGMCHSRKAPHRTCSPKTP